MIKKVICPAIVFLLLLSFASCGKDPGGNGDGDDFVAFSELQKSMTTINDAEFKMNLDTTTDGSTITNVSMESMGAQVKNKQSYNMAIDIEMNVEDMILPVELYLKDDIIYTKMAEQKTKMPAGSPSQFMSTDLTSLLNVNKDMITDFKATKEGGTTVYTFSVLADYALDYYKKSPGSNGTGLDALGKVDFSKMDIEIVADKDNMVKTMTLESVMSLTTDDGILNVNDTLTVEYLSINTGTTIKFPDFSEYIEAPAM